MGKNIKVDNPLNLAASSAHVSGPEQPPDTMTSFFDNEFTSFDIDDLDVNFLDPTIPIFIETPSFQKAEKSRLLHIKRAFIGCFAVHKRIYIDYNQFRQWKNNPEKELTDNMALSMVPYINNHYDFITTAPPSRNRNIENYCAFKLCESLSKLTNIPFIIAFQKRKHKKRHGRYASMESEKPEFVDSFNYKNKSILFIDDFVTSGCTAKACFVELKNMQNHVDGLIYCDY